MSNADDQFANVVDALMRPSPPIPSTMTRVADLYPADGRLGNAAQNAGFDVVYQIEPKNSQEIFDFADVPPFDVVTANMPDDDNERADALEFVLRFLRVRRPEIFLMMGMGWNTNGTVFTGLVRGKTGRLGYTVTKTGIDSETRHGFIIGALRAARVTLPPEDERPATGRSRTAAGDQPALPMPPVVEQILRNLN